MRAILISIFYFFFQKLQPASPPVETRNAEVEAASAQPKVGNAHAITANVETDANAHVPLELRSASATANANKEENAFVMATANVLLQLVDVEMDANA